MRNAEENIQVQIRSRVQNRGTPLEVLFPGNGHDGIEVDEDPCGHGESADDEEDDECGGMGPEEREYLDEQSDEEEDAGDTDTFFHE